MMTSRERMMAAYRNEIPDRVPVSPELWYVTTLEYTKVPFHRYLGPLADLDFIEAWHHTQKHFEFDSWILTDFEMPEKGENYEIISKSGFFDEDTVQGVVDVKTAHGDLHMVNRTTVEYEYWLIEHAVKDLRRDLPAYLEITTTTAGFGTDKIRRALDTVGDDGLVSVNLGELFISYLAFAREGDISQTLLDIFDEEDYLMEVREKYIAFLCEKIEIAKAIPGVESLLINCGYADGGTIGPTLYEKWEVPLIRVIAEKANRHGLALHLHQHGKSAKIVPLVAETGISLIDSLEHVTAHGDVEDLAAIKRDFGDKIALKGNIDPLNVLKNGTPQQIESMVASCIEAAGAGGGYILSTGDGIISNTPFENIFAFAEAGAKYGNIY